MDRKTIREIAMTTITVLVVVFAGVYLFSRLSRWYTIDLSNKGTLGDAVNGLSAPIISFISAILIYITFREQNKANLLQVDANRMLQNQWLFDTSLKILDSVKESHRRINVSYQIIQDISSYRKYFGKDALIAIATRDSVKLVGYHPAIDKFDQVFSELDELIRTVMENKFYDRMFTMRLLNFYNKEIDPAAKIFLEQFETDQAEEKYGLFLTLQILSENVDDLKDRIFKARQSERKNIEERLLKIWKKETTPINNKKSRDKDPR